MTGWISRGVVAFWNKYSAIEIVIRQKTGIRYLMLK
jgi:hypothetical protein